MDAAKDIVEQASRNFREQLTPGLFEKFQGTQVQDLKRQILDFQSLLERRNLLRDFKRINPFIAALEGITDVIPLSHDQTACVWGPVKHILLVRYHLKTATESSALTLE
ncbi:hypothetical protein F4808DRAFT_355229 [Astrocystis sublimbata]|nr:hypothetical protein F4808DRAFT_355229 [Astrocystis sublimbata]